MEILILLSIILLIFSWMTNTKKKYNPLIIFNGLWLIIYIMYWMNLFDFFIELDLSTYVVLAVMQIAFTVGGMIGNRIIIKFGSNFPASSLKPKKEWLLREKVFIILSLTAIILTFVEEISIIVKLLQGESFSGIMVDAEGKNTVTISGAFNVSLHMFFLYPMSYVISPVCAIESVYRKNKPVLFFIINVAMTTLSVVHHGGRNALFQMALCYILVFLISEKETKMKLRSRILLTIGIILGAALVINISESRGIGDIKGSFYGYLTCSIPLSNQFLQSNIVQNHQMMGMYSFKGFFSPIFTALNFFGFPRPKSLIYALDFANFIEESYMYIGNNTPHRFNAFMSAGASLYADGGYVFEFLVMIIYGWLSGALFRKVKDPFTCNCRVLCLFIFIMIGIVFSFARFWFSSYHYALAMIYILLLYHNNNSGKHIIKNREVSK